MSNKTTKTTVSQVIMATYARKGVDLERLAEVLGCTVNQAKDTVTHVVADAVRQSGKAR